MRGTLYYILGHSFHVYLLAAQMLFFRSFQPRKHFARIFPAVALPYLILPYFGLYDALILNGWLNLSYLLLFAASLMVLAASFRFRPIELIFIGIVGYVIQHFAEKLTVLCVMMITVVLQNSPFATSELFTAIYYFTSPVFTLLTCVACYFLLARRFRREYLTLIRDWSILILFSCSILVVYLLSSAITLLEGMTPAVQILVDLFFITFCCLLLSLIFFLFFSGKLIKDIEQVEQMLAMEKRQYEISKSNIDLINRKCHDLKHQIRMLKTIGSDAERLASIAEMEKAISIYESMVKTGNESLDIIITEKQLQCESKGIRLACILDGKKLEFIRSSEICSLFGNILDNAIQAAEKLEEQEKRQIVLNLYEQKGMLFLHEENFFNGELKYSNGELQSTSEDDGFHGFGMSSIRHIVERYGGVLALDIREDIFAINIMLPLLK